MTQRSPDEAMKATAAAQDAVIEQGGVLHEDAMWDAAEMALDGCGKESMVERLQQPRARPYVPKGGWTCR